MDHVATAVLAGCIWGPKALETTTGHGKQATLCQQAGLTGNQGSLTLPTSFVCEQL